eukprot:CAMPEP_0205907354 /NCGR_PEP_ID=MMETSP1325-20131115/2496_1 /ASSEMBLY_ACC=CAM_ASM_000708 /TAXON_ID=236786 /ORGANISM="Florenciella sp., Strain RCC1007" /LENGTH=217 /DNA_ID=CAMNT_0053273445 /DNA_START=75 /DNA_END=728 /DNA_ORIENTATION=-
MNGAPSSGFRNIKPMSRDERRALKDKVALEKDRLMKRSGLAAKQYRENAPKDSMGLTCPDSNAAGFLADADRFHSDVSGEELIHRQQVYERKQQVYENTRVKRAEREEQRWQKIEQARVAEEEFWEKQREDGSKSKKNASCVPYDTITLKYDDTLDGERLRYDDDMVRYRAALRSQNLMVCGDTRASFDIINGVNRPPAHEIPAPQPSEQLKQWIDK